jgi:UDP-N-acetylmuramoyl-L-alanyl-D-glutamate--2,6-diaminopimelate ligase
MQSYPFLRVCLGHDYHHSQIPLGFKPEKIIPLLHKLKPPLGRMRKIDNHLIWIDYAHTPDAIENAICTLQQHYPTHDIRVV